MTAPMGSTRWHGGVIAQSIARDCGVPDPDRVIRVTYDGAPTFHYDDGRLAFELPGMVEVGRGGQ